MATAKSGAQSGVGGGRRIGGSPSVPPSPRVNVGGGILRFNRCRLNFVTSESPMGFFIRIDDDVKKTFLVKLHRIPERHVLYESFTWFSDVLNESCMWFSDEVQPYHNKGPIDVEINTNWKKPYPCFIRFSVNKVCLNDVVDRKLRNGEYIDRYLANVGMAKNRTPVMKIPGIRSVQSLVIKEGATGVQVQYIIALSGSSSALDRPGQKTVVPKKKNSRDPPKVLSLPDLGIMEIFFRTKGGQPFLDSHKESLAHHLSEFGVDVEEVMAQAIVTTADFNGVKMPVRLIVVSYPERNVVQVGIRIHIEMPQIVSKMRFEKAAMGPGKVEYVTFSFNELVAVADMFNDGTATLEKRVGNVVSLLASERQMVIRINGYRPMPSHMFKPGEVRRMIDHHEVNFRDYK